MPGLLAILERFLRVGGRRKAFFVLRAGGAALVAGSTAMAIATVVSLNGGGLASGVRGPAVFQTFAITQLGLLTLVAVVLGASTMSQEREGRTLGILVASGIHPVALAGGLALGSWIRLAAGLLAGLPLALLLLLLGGITLEGALLAYLITFSASIFVVGLSSFVSARSPSTVWAILTAATLLIILYFFVPLARGLVHGSPALGTACMWFNPFPVLSQVTDPEPETGFISLQGTSWALSGVLLAVAGATGIRRLETWKSRTLGGARTLPHRQTPRSDRLGWGRVAPRRGQLGWIVTWVSFGTTLLVSGVVIIGVGTPAGLRNFVLPVLALVMWLGCLFQSLAAFGNWRREGRLTLLLTTPIPTREILGTKVLGIARHVLPLFCVYLIGSGVSILFPWSGPLASRLPYAVWMELLGNVANLTAFLALTALLGIWATLIMKTTLRAVIMTLGVLVLFYIVLNVVSLFFFFYLQPRSAIGPGPLVTLLMQASYPATQGLASWLIWVGLVRYFDHIVERCP